MIENYRLNYKIFRTLMFAAMDTTSSALARLLHLLSLIRMSRDKLRKEINEAREAEGGDLP